MAKYFNLRFCRCRIASNKWLMDTRDFASLAVHFAMYVVDNVDPSFSALILLSLSEFFKQINNCISVNVHVPWLGDYLRRLFCGFARANCWGNFHRPDNNSFGSSNHGSRFIPAFFIPSEAHNCRRFRATVPVGVLINAQINKATELFSETPIIRWCCWCHVYGCWIVSSRTFYVSYRWVEQLLTRAANPVNRAWASAFSHGILEGQNFHNCELLFQVFLSPSRTSELEQLSDRLSSTFWSLSVFAASSALQLFSSRGGHSPAIALAIWSPSSFLSASCMTATSTGTKLLPWFRSTFAIFSSWSKILTLTLAG